MSALLRVPVKRSVAMTGEITLRGRVLPIGGLKEKILAAHRAGITTVIMPKENAKDLRDIPRKVLKAVRVCLAEHMDEVLRVALVLPNPDGFLKELRASLDGWSERTARERDRARNPHARGARSAAVRRRSESARSLTPRRPGGVGEGEHRRDGSTGTGTGTGTSTGTGTGSGGDSASGGSDLHSAPAQGAATAGTSSDRSQRRIRSR